MRGDATLFTRRDEVEAEWRIITPIEEAWAHLPAPAGIIGSILTDSPVEPSASNAMVPAKLNRVILKALEKDRNLRYQSATLLSADLEEWEQSRVPSATLRTLWFAKTRSPRGH